MIGILDVRSPYFNVVFGHFQIRIEARDSGIPTWLSTDLDLTIYVRNVNDHPPQFPFDVFQVNVTGKKKTYCKFCCVLFSFNYFGLLEHESTSEIIRLPETVDLDEPDEVLNTRELVCYFIVGGNQLKAFSLDRAQHTLTVC